MTSIICSGFGGQGILTAGLILAKIGMDNGKNVTWIPSYGSEMRGGTANCSVKISDEEISSPFVKSIDILIAMNQPSIDKFESLVAKGGTVISNRSIVSNHEFRNDINVIEVDATKIADELENPRGANIVMIGAMTSASPIFEKEVMIKGVDNFFASKGKMNPKNRLCFEKGYEAALKCSIKP